VVRGRLDEAGGFVIALVKALLVLSTARRLHVALLMNHLYQFSTWRWGWALTRMLMIAVLLRYLICRLFCRRHRNALSKGAGKL
jgi:hypothetical protein